ncbi:phosphoenolpyruvate mutase [Actinopolyspora mzabensis]|uniref:phosphoenolpyruvate mutase n=1 Tax=Actinopolyspora mzabensis TaxID=995066 RepID=A0A1G9A2E8_ACTMZ|nr:phosphoenolpyruvate mutase [Actinopolyspora mzabensis]
MSISTRTESPESARQPEAGSGRPGRFRRMLASPELSFAMEAHDGLSARIAQAEGFRALWASGLSISTAMGLRDNNEASWSQFLQVVELMADATSVPIVVDGDSGHGNFNSARRFFRKAEQVGAAAVSLEDKIFPKMNSFVGTEHELAPAEEFCAKIRACKDSQQDPEFCLIARTESLIAGVGMREAIDRAEQYRLAGADAIFIHSKKQVSDEIVEFSQEWGERLPLVIAPTTYAATTPTDIFRRCGISTVIWANHSMRAAFAAIRQTCREIRDTESVSHLETLAPLSNVFDLLDYDELERAESRFFTDHPMNG